MINWRRFAVWLTNLFLGLDLYLLAMTITLIYTLGSAAYIKSVITSSGLYDNFAGSALKLATTKLQEQPDDEISQNVIDELSPIIQKVVTPSLLKTNLELAIDSFNGWLSGKSTSPSFTIDLHQAKADLADQITVYLENKMAKLPVCQSYADYQAYDPLSATCRPPVSLTTADYQNVANSFLSSVPLLDKPTINVDPLGSQSNPNNNSVLRNLPTFNKLFRLSPWLFGVICAIGMTGVLVLSRSKARAFRLIGHTFLWSSGILLVSGAVALIFLGRDSSDFVGKGTADQIAFAKELFVPIAQRLSRSFGGWALYFGTGYAITGAICYFVAHRLRLKELRSPGTTAVDPID